MAHNVLTIDLSAIRKNLHTFSQSHSVMAMVKANGYGTCAVTLGRFLEQEGASLLGVATLDEAAALCDAGIRTPIFLLHCTPHEAEAAVEYGLHIALWHIPLLEALEKSAMRLKRIPSLHLFLNSGMNRLGCSLEEASGLAKRIQASPHLQLSGVMSHLSAADDPQEDTWTLQQVRLFDRLLKELPSPPLWRHIANTAGALRFSWPQCNLTRVGLGLYGAAPSSEVQAMKRLTPALTLHSPLIEIHSCSKGESVGYQRAYRVKRAVERIGLLPIGYADGIHIRHSSRGEVLLHGRKAPIVGRICMDFLMIDLTHHPEAKIGDRALLFGPGLPIEEVADRVGTTPYELICCIGNRVGRRFTDNN